METAAMLALPSARWATEMYLRERDRGVLANKPHHERQEQHPEEMRRKERDAFYWQVREMKGQWWGGGGSQRSPLQRSGVGGTLRAKLSVGACVCLSRFRLCACLVSVTSVTLPVGALCLYRRGRGVSSEFLQRRYLADSTIFLGALSFSSQLEDLPADRQKC